MKEIAIFCRKTYQIIESWKMNWVMDCGQIKFTWLQMFLFRR